MSQNFLREYKDLNNATQELLIVQKYKKFAQKYLDQEQIKSLAEFSYRVQFAMPPRQVLNKYPQMPRQAIDVMWWSESQDDIGGYVWRRLEELLELDAWEILFKLGLLPAAPDGSIKEVVYEVMFAVIVKSLAIASLNVELPQERTTEQINGINLFSLI
jgi:hypothetical protein